MDEQDKATEGKSGELPSNDRVAASSETATRQPEQPEGLGHASPDPSAPPADKGPQVRLGTNFVVSRKIALWIVVAIGTAIISAVVSANANAAFSFLSAQRPLDVHSAASLERPHTFEMIVTQPDKLPPGLNGTQSCSELYDAGLSAGGVVPSAERFNVLLQGHAKEGVSIVNMHAVITKTAPPQGGVVLNCPSQGASEAIPLKFDLSRVNSAPAVQVLFDPSTGNQTVNRFDNGYVINVAENEAVPLNFTASLPEDAAYWHIEADTIIAGRPHTVIIDDNGKDFYSPGHTAYDFYDRGYAALPDGGEVWGIDPSAQHYTDSSGAQRITSEGVTFPAPTGTDLYKPSESRPDANPGSAYKTIRNGRNAVVEYNLAPTSHTPFGGQDCNIDRYGSFAGDNDAYGVAGKVNLLPTSFEMHGAERFAVVQGSYTCTLLANQNGKPIRSVLRTFILEKTAGSAIDFVTDLPSYDPNLATARSILSGIQVGPPR